MKLEEMTTNHLKEIDDSELLMAWLRLNQWYNQKPEEKFIDAARRVLDVGLARGVEFDTSLPLYQIAMKGESPEIVIVPEFVDLVGSYLEDPKSAGDVDVLIRAERDGSQHYLLDAQSLDLVISKNLRNDLPEDSDLHFVPAPAGPHDTYSPLWDLVLRPSRRRWQKLKMSDKSEPLFIDLGCGDAKPSGYVGIDIEQESDADVVHNLEEGIPYPDGSAMIVRANHVLEHLSDPQVIMDEIYRVLAPGGIADITVPSTMGTGAYVQPDHKSFWNWKSFVQDERFRILNLQEVDFGGGKVDTTAALQKPIAESLQKAIQKVEPLFDPRGNAMPKPAMSLRISTEAFDPEEVWDGWGEERAPVYVEPKLNGYRALLQISHNEDLSVHYDDLKTDRSERLLEADSGLTELLDLPDCVLDCDIAIVENGKRWNRAKLTTLNADKPEIPSGASLLITAFDLIYWKDKSYLGVPFKDRREALKDHKSELASHRIMITPARLVESQKDLEGAWDSNSYGKRPMSEGLVLKDPDWEYGFTGGTNGMAKLKHAVELKALILEIDDRENGEVYRGGLLPSEEPEVTNLVEYDEQDYADLGFSFVGDLASAEVGSIGTFEVEELNYDDEDQRLNWLGAIPLDVDDTREIPYHVAQAVDIADRGKVYIESQERRIVKGRGPAGSIAFIGSHPTYVDAIRGEPFTGLDGATLRDVYLAPLGLEKSDVYLTNMIPVPLDRLPSSNQVLSWRGHLESELAEADPLIVVALGTQAESFLGSKADFFLPHPYAVRKYGDSGEVRRKLARIHRVLTKMEKLRDEGGEKPATEVWMENWTEAYPKSGKGKFVYHHHWRGLEEEQTELPESGLLETGHSIHGDLRLTSDMDDKLWGITAFLGEAKDNDPDKLFDLRGKSNKLRMAFKPFQPHDWIDVGKRSPYVSEPGGVGATSKSWALFRAMDWGEYRIGVWKSRFFEIFLEGTKRGGLKGRYICQWAKFDSRRVWLLSAPENQTPYAEEHELEAVMEEMAEKNERWLLWSDGESKPVLYDTKSMEEVEKGDPFHVEVPLLKVDEEQQLVYGVVSEPFVPDTQDDYIPIDEVEEAAHRYLIQSRVVGVNHSKAVNAEVVESYVAPQDLTINEKEVKAGSWVLAVHVMDDEIWEDVKAGKLTGFSLGGYGVRHAE